MIIEKKCTKCGKNFHQNQSPRLAILAGFSNREEQEPICSFCCVGDNPEPADFDRAAIRSGEMTDLDLSEMRREMRFRGEDDLEQDK